jgi:hypothetical protein
MKAQILAQSKFIPTKKYDGRVILFLDFDGVLHAFKAGFIEEDLWLQNHFLESILKELDNVDVVVSSMWAKKRTLAELKAYFSEDVRHRFVGHVTRHTEERYNDVRGYLASRGQSDAVWIAVDDLATFHVNDPVVRTDHLIGLTKETAQTLRNALISPLEYYTFVGFDPKISIESIQA